MNILDLILIAILIGCIYIGYFRGLFKTVIEFFGFLFGIISFYILYPIINNFLFETKIKNFIIDKLSFTNNGQKISNYIFDKITNFAEQSISNSNILSFQQSFENLNSNNTNNEILNNFFKPVTNNISNLFQNIVDNFFNSFVHQISNFVAFIIISIITAITLTILITIINIFLTHLVKSVLKSYVVDKFDKIGGICIGAISGFLLIYIITVILYIISIFALPLRDHLDGFLAPMIIKNFNGIVLTYIIKLILDFIREIL